MCDLLAPLLVIFDDGEFPIFLSFARLSSPVLFIAILCLPKFSFYPLHRSEIVSLFCLVNEKNGS